MVRNLALAVGWIMLAVIVVLSLVPPSVRPTTIRSLQGDHFTVVRTLAVAAAWTMLVVIVVLSLVPPWVRPTAPGVPHHLEHAAIFFLNGAAFSIAYLGYERWLKVSAIAFCAAIELAQLMVPGRHARVSDFLVDAVAACIGIFAGPLMIRWMGHPALRSNHMEL